MVFLKTGRGNHLMVLLKLDYISIYANFAFDMPTRVHDILDFLLCRVSAKERNFLRKIPGFLYCKM